MVKTVTNQQLIGSQGEAFVKERANAMGFMFTPYDRLEAGIDGLLEIRDPVKGTATGRLVAVQVKTRQSGSYTAENDAGFEYLMDANDVEYWRGCNLPVIIVLVHLERREAYWKTIDAGGDASARRLRVDKKRDLFAVSARDVIADLCVAKSGFGVWFPPLKTGETGHLNLLQVSLPDYIYVGASPFKTGREALHELLDHEDRPPDDWIIRGSQFVSFRDPRVGPLAHIVDTGSIEDISVDEVVFPGDEADERRIIELLRRTLGAQLDGTLAYSRDQRAFYFPAVPDTIERVYPYKSLKQYTSAAVVKKYEKDGKVKYVRHHAFEPRFWRVADQWFLSVTPTFVFTWDGFRPDKFASSRLSGKKQREHNPALLGQFVMWRFLLCEPESSDNTGALFGPEQEKERFLRFKGIEPLALPRGVPDDLWRRSEPEPVNIEGQRRLPV